ncbi:FMN-binding protein [Nocardioides islandensis]|uniref:FMN-binding protein n=1 Tax=Nocardioides islandensis TaxID=433663 RepID=A0A930YF06_9ACTN|nr:FMN-binding protein [Nocardioides islandensis]MBF4764308.1 FMN-binding protein [Nocardioides islandensis]
MKRITTWILSTITVVVLMFGYHTSTSSTLASGAGNPPVISSGTTAGGSSGSGTSGSGTSGSGTSGSSGSGSGSSGSTSSTSSAKKSTTATGDVAQTQWGPVQVELTVSGGKITDVSVLQYPSGNGQDAQINGYALPVLIQETLDQQSASIDMVSGATVTSVGYLQSLQSALDQAGL